jgi:hypothetical protein
MKTAMTHRPMSALVAVSIIALSGTPAGAQTPQEVKTEKNKSLILGNFMNALGNCSTNPGPLPLPILRERPAHGTIGIQIVIGDAAATNACAARKVPAIAIFYTPARDFVGKDSIQIEFDTADQKIPGLSFVITVQPGEQN